MPKPTFEITFTHAVELVDAYRKHFLESESPKVPNILGGTLNKDLILKHRMIWRDSRAKAFPELPELYEGLVAWTCWKSNTPMEMSDFFLAFEINDGIVIENVGTQFPDFPKLARPFEIIDNEDKAVTTEQILRNKTGINPPRRYEDVIERGNRYDEEGKVLKMSLDFKIDGPKQEDDESYNPFPFGLFENKNTDMEVDKFLDQIGSKYIRYYLGYDPDKSVNKIRIILFGVDENGKNILPTDANKIDNTDSVIIQNSWPPK